MIFSCACFLYLLHQIYLVGKVVAITLPNCWRGSPGMMVQMITSMKLETIIISASGSKLPPGNNCQDVASCQICYSEFMKRLHQTDNQKKSWPFCSPVKMVVCMAQSRPSINISLLKVRSEFWKRSDIHLLNHLETVCFKRGAVGDSPPSYPTTHCTSAVCRPHNQRVYPFWY